MSPEEKSALLEVVKAARRILPMLEAIRYTEGLGRTQVERMEALKVSLANLDKRNP